MYKTVDQRQKEVLHAIKLSRGRHYQGLIKGGKRPDLESIYFRCTWEANFARLLNQLEIEWMYENRTFWFDGIKSGTVNYTPDFLLPTEDTWVEVKGQWDSRSKTKLRRFRKFHFDEFKKLLVVCGDIYGKSKTAKSVRRFLMVDLELPPDRIMIYPAIARKFKSIIKGWE